MSTPNPVQRSTASEEYVNLVERAKALLSHTQPLAGLDELHLRAMRALVADLEKRKYAVKPTAPPASAAPTASTASRAPRQRGRSVPAAVRRAVWRRDDGRCTYTDPATEQRCRATHRLQLHYEAAFARGGAHDPSNFTLRCAAHNALAAEKDFGCDFITHRRDVLRHEPHSRQSMSGPG
jgi:hypothetical protein